MSLWGALYNTFLKKTSMFCLLGVASAVIFEEAFEAGCEKIFETANKGKLFKDMKLECLKPREETYSTGDLGEEDEQVEAADDAGVVIEESQESGPAKKCKPKK
ncbi:cytochrome b-c1 complex subunit 9-like [Aethina tumida]|uniref:cytochrome b-c1 complex subunit 9-like n=1 Tax=Aethina tumida TaxID=116153 RepID=UPI00214720E5|nr:cytochrome b-c1 complex subunit 9-like [Aethina tumida]